MLKRTENKMAAPLAHKNSSTNELHGRLADLRTTEAELMSALQRARGIARERTERLREAEDEYLRSEIDLKTLSAAREEAADALNCVEPADSELKAHQTLVARCSALLKQAEDEDRRQAEVELGQRQADWSQRYAEALSKMLELTCEGETILAEARKRCPETAVSWAKQSPLTELSPALKHGIGYTLPHISAALRWVLDLSSKTGHNLPSFAATAAEPYLQLLAKLETTNARMGADCAATRKATAEKWGTFLHDVEAESLISGPGGIVMRW